MMKTLRCLLVALLAMTLAPVTASAIGIEAAIGGWRQSPSGDIGYNPLTEADRLDLERDARYDDETRLFGRVKIDLPMLPNIYLMATPVEFEGVGQRASSFRFGGQDFDANVPFSSKVVLDQYDIALYYGIPLLETATLNTLNIELGINLRIIDASVEATQEASGLSDSRSAVLPVPMIYLGVQLKPLDWLALEAEARGMAYSDNRYLDLIGRLKVSPVGPVFVAAGWRHQDVKIDSRDIEADMKIKGPFAEAGFVF
jgi:outer membrane protein